VAIDLWSEQCQLERIVLKVRSGNVAALILLTKMRPPSSTIAVVARELALKLVDLSFPPDAEHTPGIGHVIVDRLSRVYSPTGTGKVSKDIHPALNAAQESVAPDRVGSWYKV
jgi:hypothetical protein